MLDISQFTFFDYAVFGIITISTVFAFFRGFIYSFLYFFGWVLAAILVAKYYPVTSEYISMHVKSKLLTTFCATIGLYLMLLIILTLINSQLLILTSIIRGGILDRFLGVLFGVVRGILICCVMFFTIIVGLSAIDDSVEPKWLSKSVSYPLLEEWTGRVIALVASDVEKKEVLDFMEKYKNLGQESIGKNSHETDLSEIIIEEEPQKE